MAGKTVKLTDKQELFISEYLTCWNAAEAARRAGYSPASARSIGSENLTKPNIAAEIKARIAEKTMSADEVLVRLSEQARFDVGRYMIEGRVSLTAVVLDGKGHLIKSVKERQFGTDIEFHSPFDALQLIGKHHKLFVERQEITGANGEPLQFNTVIALTVEQELAEWRKQQQQTIAAQSSTTNAA